MIAVMVPLIISHDGAVHKDTIRRWKNFSLDIKVYWVRMAQSVLRYNVAIVGRFFNKGSWVSEAWRKAHPEEDTDETGEPPERMPTTEERRELLNFVPVPTSAVCVRSSAKPRPHRVRLTSAEGCHPVPQEARANQTT